MSAKVLEKKFLVPFILITSLFAFGDLRMILPTQWLPYSKP